MRTGCQTMTSSFRDTRWTLVSRSRGEGTQA